MQLIEWPQFLEEALPFGENRSAITVGVFDGVHRGHRALIERVVAHKVARGAGTVPVAVTFRQSNYKKNLGAGREYPGDILSFRQKLAIFEDLGVSVTIVIDFSESFMRMSGTDFLRILYDHGKMSFLAVGSNFRCGFRLDTDAPAIQKFCAGIDIPAAVIEPLTEGSQPISSSRIRSALSHGNLNVAQTMLGHPFTVDLAGASVSRSGIASNAIVYDIAGQGRLLPQPGSYSAILLAKAGRDYIRKPAEILVEGGNIIIGGKLADTAPEYVEFKP